MQAIANDHDTVDQLCWRHLGRTHGVVEATLALNPGLADHGAQLPGGTVVQLANVTITQTRTTVQLWD